MGDEKSRKDYPNPAQRAAVCTSMFERKTAGNADEKYVESAEYQGRKVTLNKPFRTPGGPRKFAVYVQNEAGRVIIVRFGDPNMEIKRDDPARRKNFRSRHNCDSPGPRTKARYWSCRQWESGRKVEASEEHEALGEELWFDIWSKNEGEVIDGIEEVIEELGSETMVEAATPTPKTNETHEQYMTRCQAMGNTKDECMKAHEGHKFKEQDKAHDGTDHYKAQESCCNSCAEHAHAEEISKDVFDNPGEATNRSKEIGCDGIHTMEKDGKTIFMPCKNHDEYSKKTGEKLASYGDDEDEKKVKADTCGIGEEMGTDGICRPVNVTMEVSIDEVVAKVEAKTGKTYIEISGIAFHEGMNKNKWSLTANGAKNAVEQMVGADLTLNHPKPLSAGGFERNMDGGVNEAVVGEVTAATYHNKEAGYDVRYKAVVSRSELFEALESGMWLRPGYGVSIGGFGVPIKADETGMIFDKDFKFDHLAIVHKPAYQRANIETATRKMVEVEARHGGQHGRPGPNDPRKTPAKPSERRRGSKKNPPGSAKKPNTKIQVSEATRKTISNKMREHNAKKKGSRASMGALLTVFRRGAGAFSTSHAPNMSRNGWGIARVNAFLYLLRNGRPSNPNYKQDNDLLPKGHPRAKRTASAKTLIPQPKGEVGQTKEAIPMSDEHIPETEMVEASEMEAIQAELILARAEIENFKAMEAAKAEESRLGLVASATELGMTGHEDLSESTLESLIASWNAAHPEPAPVEMKPVTPAPAVASEAPAAEAAEGTPVIANYLNGKMVETPEHLYEKAWNAWASAWNRTLSGVEMSDSRFRAPRFDEKNNF
tara:strand:+ start:5634 stop:8114 length:2481 start_codon:yes stop_codon:yes gene_type:complete